MSYRNILLYLIFIHISAQTFNNQDLFIPRTSCTIKYSNNSTSIIFQQCNRINFVSHDWRICFVSCCYDQIPKGYETISLKAIQACKSGVLSENQLTFQQKAIIISCTILMAIVCLCFFCKLCLKLKSKKIEAGSQNIILVEWRNEQQINTKINNIKWSDRSNRKKPLKELSQPCSICLEQGTTSVLICKHQYHPRCIGAWLKKTNCCPCCRQENIECIKIFCQKCRWKYMICTKKLLANYSIQLPQQCNSCMLDKQQQVVESLAEIFPQASNQMIQATRNIQESVQ